MYFIILLLIFQSISNADDSFYTYTDAYGYKRFCFVALDSDVKVETSSETCNYRHYASISSIFLLKGAEDINTTLEVSNLLTNRKYYFINYVSKPYCRLDIKITGNIQIGYCPEFHIANSLGLNEKDVNYLAGLAGIISATIFIGGLTYLFIGLK